MFGNTCVICGDRHDHNGLPHGDATGDGRTRLDVPTEVERMALHRWMFDAEFVARGKIALGTLELLGDEITPELRRAVIIGAFCATYVLPGN